MDLGKYFKIVKYKSRTTTTDGSNCPLRKYMIAGHKKKHNYSRLKLAEKKILDIVECTRSLSQVKLKVHSSDTIKPVVFHCGLVNNTNKCPIAYVVMKASNV